MIKRLADEETAGEKSGTELHRNLVVSQENMVKRIGEETKYSEMIMHRIDHATPSTSVVTKR